MRIVPRFHALILDCAKGCTVSDDCDDDIEQEEISPHIRKFFEDYDTFPHLTADDVAWFIAPSAGLIKEKEAKWGD